MGTGSDGASMTLVVPGEPTLLVTHMPLWSVPAGRVNVHGHVHNHEALRPEPFVNICVEQTRLPPAAPSRRFGSWPPAGSRTRGRGERPTLEEIEHLGVAPTVSTHR